MPNHKRIAKILGSTDEPGSVLFVLFIPSKTKGGKDLPKGQDQRVWAANAGDELTESFGGSTEMPGARGKWLNDESGEIVTEPVILVHSYAKESDAEDRGKLLSLAKFLHRMGKTLRQGEVALVIDNVFHRIRKFPLAEEESDE